MMNKIIYLILLLPHIGNISGAAIFTYLDQFEAIKQKVILDKQLRRPNTTAEFDLEKAVIANNSVKVEELLNIKTYANITDLNGDALLIIATKKGNLEIVKLLLTKGHANPNVFDNNRSTSLHWAVTREFTEIVKLLLQNNADYTMLDSTNKTPMQIIQSQIKSIGVFPHTILDHDNKIDIFNLLMFEPKRREFKIILGQIKNLLIHEAALPSVVSEIITSYLDIS